MKMKGFYSFYSYFVLFLSIFSLSSCITEDYFNLVCNTSVSVGTSRKLESSTSLFYDANVACSYTVTVDVGKRVMLLLRRFDLETEVKGSCVDFVNIHDGSSTSAAALNASPLCGEIKPPVNYTSSSNTMTLWFQTDATGNKHGFDVIFVAITIAPCNSGQFACTSGVCVDGSLHCTVYDECGDDSDETNCEYPELQNVAISSDAPLIIGLTISLLVLIVILLVVGLWCWKQNRWRIFAKRPLTANEIVFDETNFETAYPVTKIYYKEQYQDMYRDPVKPEIDYGATTVRFAGNSSTSSVRSN